MDKPKTSPRVPTPVVPTPTLPLSEPIPTEPEVKKKWTSKRIWLFSGIGAAIVLVAIVLSGWLIYQYQLSPLGTNQNEKIIVVIAPRTTPAQIGQILLENKVIRSDQAFGIYTRLSGTQNNLQAGTYRLSPAESTPQIVDHLVNGNVDTFDITFLPGATLAQNKKVLTDAGYDVTEVDTALNASYSSPLFATKPTSADLEGYIYGDTYKFGSGATVAEILQYTFDTYAQVIETNGFVAKFKAHDLTLYEGITLASIIQRESVGGDEAQIAQVFYSRMAKDMVLGSDVTYQYIADKTGVARDPNLDSPYNTRRYPGLPPGPIATPGLAALQAVASPAAGDYLYFLSGDDDITYFARTNAEHEQNIADHCKEKCSTL